MMKRWAVRFVVLFCAVSVAWAIGFVPQLHAQAESYYKGKTIRVIVGSSAGNFYDLWGRLVARHWGKHIPGNPDVIVQNMPGAGSLVATNYVYNVAKPDGLTVVTPNNSIYIEQLVGRKEVQFDLRKFHWIGSAARESIIMYMRADAPFKSIADIVKAQEPPRCGGSGTTSSDYIVAKILELTLGAKINTVLGYLGGAEADTAVEKGEILCRAHTLSAHFGREPFNTWHKKGFDRHLLQTGRKRDPQAPEAPTIYELMDEYKIPSDRRRIVQAMLSGGEFGRPMMATPGTQAERIKILREAYLKALRDPELLADAKKGKMEVDYASGEELEALVNAVLDQPPEVIEQVRKILGK